MLLRRRLALCTHLAWARRGLGPPTQTIPAVDASRQAILGRAVREAVLDALRTADPGFHVGSDVRVRWTVIGSSTRPGAQGRSRHGAGTSVHVQVPPTWLAEVWAPGHATTGDGGFVLSRVRSGVEIRRRVARWERDGATSWVLRTTVETSAPAEPLR